MKEQILTSGMCEVSKKKMRAKGLERASCEMRVCYASRERNVCLSSSSLVAYSITRTPNATTARADPVAKTLLAPPVALGPAGAVVATVPVAGSRVDEGEEDEGAEVTEESDEGDEDVAEEVVEELAADEPEVLATTPPPSAMALSLNTWQASAPPSSVFKQKTAPC